MWIIFKLFFSILFSLILWFLIITSFITDQYSSADNNVLLSNFETKQDLLTWWVIHDSLSDIDEVYYSTWEIKKTEEWNITTIDLSSWEYIFSLSWIWNNYIINYKWFSLKNLWPGIFYINTIKPKKYSIFSISSLLQLNLLNLSNNSLSTEVFLYPHGYIIFNPKRNYIVSGWDALRVSTVLSWLWYFNKNILDVSWKINSEFLKNIWPLLNDKIFFTSTLKNIYDNNKVIFSKLWKIRKKEWDDVSWTQLVEEYDSLFFNKSKKVSLYKNAIYDDLNKLFFSDKRENVLVNRIYNNYNKLNLDKDSDIKKVLNNYYRYVSLESNLEAKRNFYLLYKKLSNNKVNFLPSLYYFRDIYNAYDFMWSDNLYSYMNIFIKQYFNDLGVSIWKNQLLISDEYYTKLEYFSLYLMKLLLTYDSFDKETVSKIISIFDYYVLLDNNLYWWKSEKKIATWVKNHLDVLTNISKSIRTYYFEDERNEFNLLLKKKIEIDSNNIKDFKKNIDSLIEFFDSNINIFKWNTSRINNYKTIKKDMDEYFLALLDYEWYKSKYNSNSVLNKLDTTTNLEKDYAVNILSNFENLSIDWISVKIVDDEYFIITWLMFGNEPLSFKLYPYKNNLIDEIIISWNELEWNYELWEVSDKAGNIKTKVWKDFFIEIFSWRDLLETERTYYSADDEPEYISTDDLVFKRDILLWEKWEFSNLSDILSLGMNNIIIEDKKKWDISLNWWILKLNMGKKFGNTSYKFKFSSDYKLTSNDRYFDNIVLKSIDSVASKDKEESYLKISIKWKINNSDFREKVLDFWDALKKLLFIWNKIKKVLSESSLDVNYFLSSKKLKIKFFYLKKPVIISFVRWKIEFILYNWENILDSKIELDKLGKNLFNLKTK